MLIKEILDIEPNHFWKVLPHENRLLQKKRGLSRLTYLLLFKWFEKTASYPEDIKTLPFDLIEQGIVLSEEIISHEEFVAFFRQERIINRYKQEIRTYFGFKNFDKDCPGLHEFLMVNIFKEKNDEALKLKLCAYLKTMKVEIPSEAILLDVIKNAKTDKEQQIFSQIERLLSDKDKNYIDDYLLTSDDFDGVCQFSRQDSSDSSKEGVANEIKRLEILNQLPVASFEFISDTNIKQRNIYKRRFYTDTPERTKRRTDISRYALAIIFCFQRHQEAIDSLSVSTACAADSKQFGCFTKNLLTEWSPRHHSSGVMIYWHVSDQYICVYSQMKTCNSSEVASMLQGIMSQETEMEIESQYVDSHGQSELGFALSYLEQFDLLPRYKTIDNQKLYLPTDDFQINNIKEITTRTINWELIEEQYNEMIKHGVALKLGMATAETIIRKFARSNYQHPTFKAFMELGKAVKTTFLCRYLHSVELRQQINAGLNVVENWNGANDFVYYGKSGEITSNSRDDQEISMLCLHLLRTSISYIKTLLIEELLHDDYWINLLGEDDYRALTALFYLHINPYGSFEVDLTKRLIIKQISARAMA